MLDQWPEREKCRVGYACIAMVCDINVCDSIPMVPGLEARIEGDCTSNWQSLSSLRKCYMPILLISKMTRRLRPNIHAASFQAILDPCIMLTTILLTLLRLCSSQAF